MKLHFVYSKRQFSFFLFSLSCMFVSLSVQAGEEFVYSEYFTVSEDRPRDPQSVVSPSLSPQSHFQAMGSDLEDGFFIKAAKKALFLLKFDHHNGTFGQTREPYDRQYHYGGWSRDRRTPDCFNTRAKVLMRDSIEQVEINESTCSVTKGRWADPYSGREFYDAKDIQSDHFVPLKNSYVSGAWKWDYQKRCLYANYLGNKYHLIAASGRENMIKGDKSPDRYMPPNRNYNCQYVQQWLKLKMIWDLGLTPPEVSKIRELVQEYRCANTDLVISAEELSRQRAIINQNMDLCRPRRQQEVAH